MSRPSKLPLPIIYGEDRTSGLGMNSVATTQAMNGDRGSEEQMLRRFG